MIGLVRGPRARMDEEEDMGKMPHQIKTQEMADPIYSFSGY